MRHYFGLVIFFGFFDQKIMAFTGRLLLSLCVLLWCCWLTQRVETRCPAYGLRRCQCPIERSLDCSYEQFTTIPPINRAVRRTLLAISLVGNYIVQLRDRDVEDLASLVLLDLRSQRLVSCVRSRLTKPVPFTILGLCEDDEVCMRINFNLYLQKAP